MTTVTMPKISFKYPKTLHENLAYRNLLLDLAENDKEVQDILRTRCMQDRLFFFNVFLFTYDPRRGMIRNVPFITYEFQDNAIIWDTMIARKGKDNLIEKSRDMGCTWILIGNDIYDWLFFHEKIEIRWGSRKEDYVDKRGDMDSIFEKFRHALRNIPDWLLPEGFSWEKHDNHMRLINPETGSSLTGESTNDQFGRGGRKFRIRFDEFAFWDCDDNAWKACADATNCRTALSTPNGPGNRFAQLAKSPDIEKMTLHWTLHPIKRKGVYLLKHGEKVPINIDNDENAAFRCWLEHRGDIAPDGIKGGVVRSEWYDSECDRRKDNEVAEELDIDYLRSGMPFFDLRAVARQARWTYYQRLSPSEKIPVGRHIRASLVDVDHKIEYRESEHGWLRIFELPRKGAQYVVSGDTSEGLPKHDEAFGVVRDKYTRNVVAAFNGEYEPDDFANKLQIVGAFYNKALVAPENNNHGYSVCSDLQKMNCNLYWTERKGKDGKITRVKPGFTTTSASRPQMLDQADEDIRKDACEVRDPVILSQMETFVRNEKSGKPEADGEFLDDGVLAFAIGGQVIQERPYKPKPNATRVKREATRPANAGFRFGRRK